MKLFYYKDELGNFGDDLNPWLWDKLLPDFFDEDESSWLVGIGTLLNDKLPKLGKKYVFGSGFGYGKVPVIDENFSFFCVRGPKTASILNLDPSLALTDSAILIRAVDIPRPAQKKYKFGFMPHYQSSRYFSWVSVCESLGFNYICAEWSVDKVLEELLSCEVVICEAMHGAIVSDALRIPWIPVRCYDYISTFKWQDWLLTVDLPYQPINITSVYDIEKRMPPATRVKNIIKRNLKDTLFWHQPWDLPMPANSTSSCIDLAVKDLLGASRTPPYQSSDARCMSLTEQYLEQLDKVKKLRSATRAS
jgi:succinoglycan biosynthesis protein ExoV